MGAYFVVDWLELGLILSLLLVLSLIYTYFINKYFDQLQEGGYMSLAVAAGVSVTLIGAAIIFWPAAVLVLICFVASGLPMIIGDILRAINKRERVKDFERTIVKASEEKLKRLLHELDNDDGS